jgi:hypothetical protein
MHTKSGVPGLTGCSAIHYFVPALISTGVGAYPIGNSAEQIIGEGGGGAWAPVRLVFQHERTLFQAVAPVALWPRRARRLVAHPFVPALENRGGVSVGFVSSVLGPQIIPPAPVPEQVTHTVPTRRSALYAPLPVYWGVGGWGGLVLVVVFVDFDWEVEGG